MKLVSFGFLIDGPSSEIGEGYIIRSLEDKSCDELLRGANAEPTYQVGVLHQISHTKPKKYYKYLFDDTHSVNVRIDIITESEANRLRSMSPEIHDLEWIVDYIIENPFASGQLDIPFEAPSGIPFSNYT